MFNIILVLIMSSNVALSKMVVTPDLLVPIKQLNEGCGYDACPIPLYQDGIKVHIVPHTHYELAFQRTFAEHYVGKDYYKEALRSDVNMKRTLDGVITELWSQAHRKFTLSDMPYFFHWWSQRDENVRHMVYTLIRQGQLTFVGGGWSMNDEATTNYHAIIDSFTYSLRKINATFWECGRPLVAWQADVYGHSREFASLAAQMGYDALFINPISFDDELSRMRRWGLETLWRGSDDLGPQSDIFTHKLFDGYWSPPGFCFSSLCLDPLLVTSDTVFGNVDERARAFMDSMYNRQAPNYNNSNVMVIMGMLLGYHDAPYWFSNIDALINAVNTRAGQGKQKMYLMYSNPACYAKAVRESGMPLETKQDDFFPVAYDKTSFLTGFYTTSPSIKLMAREIMVYLQMCKQMRVFAEIGAHHNGLFEELNWVMGVFQDHDIITGYMKDNVRSYYVKKMYIAIQRSTILLREAWNKLRKCPDTTLYYRCTFNISRCHHIIGDNYFLQIQNVLAWPVTIPVRYPLQYFGEEIRVYDPKGNLVKSTLIKIPTSVLRMHSRMNTSNYEVVFIAKDLPPLGFRSYFIQRVTPINRYKREDTGNMGEGPLTSDKEDLQKINTNSNSTKENVKKDLNNIIDKDDPRGINTTKNSRLGNMEEDAQIRKRTHKQRRSNNIAEENPEARQRIPLIKNMKRKPNKKYLIRQTNPLIQDQSILYDLDEGDYDTPINDSATEKGNVTVLLESDLDEIRMRQLDDDRLGDIAENEALTESQELQMTHYQTTTKNEPKTDNENSTKNEQLLARKEQSTTKKDKYTTKILRNPVVTSSQILDQLEHSTPPSYEKNIINDTITQLNWNNVTLKHLNATNESITPQRRWNEANLDLDITNDTINAQHWNEVALNDMHLKEYHINPPKHWNKVDEIDVNNYTIKPQKWNKSSLKDLNGHRRVNNIYDDIINDMPPNRTPSPKLIVTPTPMYNIGFNGTSILNPTSGILREDVWTTGAKTDDNKEIKKIEDQTTVDKEVKTVDEEIPIEDKKEPPNKGYEENTESEVVVDTMTDKEPESERRGNDFENTEVPLMYVATTNTNERSKMLHEKSRTTVQVPKHERNEATANVSSEDTLDLRTINNTYIENKYIRIMIDPATSKISSVTLSNGVQVSLDIQFYYYVSDDPEALGKTNEPKPGGILSRAMENTAMPILDFLDYEVYKSDVVEEAHFVYSTWVSFVIRLYEESPVIEIEWMIGPIPVQDKLGKEVFVRYLTNLVHEGVFYTDSNGRQTIKRIRHLRPQFESMNRDPVAGNFYPVTSKIYIEDVNSNVCFSVFVDRAQGGTSLADGEVDLMLNRRILTDDSGSETFANDTEYEQGVIVRGKHQLYISGANHKPYKIFEKKFAKELQLAPQVLVSRPDPYSKQSKEIWFNSINEVSFLKNKLPIGVHLLTLEDWTGDTFLLRIENYLEKNDTLRGRSKTVYIQEMFTNLYITHVKETTLGANVWMEDRQKNKHTWPKKENFVRSFNDFYGVDKDVEFLKEEKDNWEPVVNFKKGIKLAPQQIRTFVCNFEYVEL